MVGSGAPSSERAPSRASPGSTGSLYAPRSASSIHALRLERFSTTHLFATTRCGTFASIALPNEYLRHRFIANRCVRTCQEPSEQLSVVVSPDRGRHSRPQNLGALRVGE